MSDYAGVYLSDAKKPDKGQYLTGSGTDGWMLTEKRAGFRKAGRHRPGGCRPLEETANRKGAAVT